MNEITKQAETLGYKLHTEDGYTAKYLGNKLHIEDGHTIVIPLDRDNYTAQVHKTYKGPWAVETTSYGLVSPDTIDMVIDGLKRAQEMVKLLNEAGL